MQLKSRSENLKMEITAKDVLLQKLKLRLVFVLFFVKGFLTLATQWVRHLKREFQNKPNTFEIAYDLTGFQAIVTGGSGDIGLACVQKLLQKNCKVVIATIPFRGQTFAELGFQLEKELSEFPRERWELIYLDLSSFRSVNKFANIFLKANRKIDILINNAGVLLLPFGKTEEGFERTMATNYLGHSLLTLNLLPVLKPSETSLRTRWALNLELKSKVVHIASHGHRYFDPDIQLLTRVAKEDAFEFSPCYAYSLSKAFIIAFNFYFSRHILPKLDSSVRVVNIHPGCVGSKNMIFENKFFTWLPMDKYENFLKNTLLWPPLQVAEHVMFGTFSDEFENQPTVYLESFENVEPSPSCADEQFQRKVYEQTIELLHPYLNDPDRFSIKTAQVA